jgi:hypothetical protein
MRRMVLVLTMVWMGVVHSFEIDDIPSQKKLYYVDPNSAIAIPYTEGQSFIDRLYRDGPHVVGETRDGVRYLINEKTGIVIKDKRYTYPNLLTGTWNSQLNSTLQLIASDNGQLSGQYQSAVGPTQDWYSLVGQYDTQAISFNDNAPITTITINVLFSKDQNDLQSIQTWNGQLLSDGQHLYTGWTLVTQSTSDRDVSRSLQFGIDQFTKQLNS